MAFFGGKKDKKQVSGRAQARPDQRSKVFSYYQNTSPSQQRPTAPSETRKLRPTETLSVGQRQKRQQLLHNLPLIIALLVLAVGIFYNTTLSSDAQVMTSSAVPGTEKLLRDKLTYQQAVTEVLNDSVLSKSKLTIRTQDIANQLIERFPELADVSVTLPLLGTRPIVHLEATRPALLMVSDNQASVVDSRGIVLMDAKDLQNTASLITVQDESGLVIEKGKPALSQEQVAYILAIKEQFDAKKIAIKHITLPPEAHQLNVYLKDAKYHGKFLFTTDSRVAAGSFIALAKDLEKQGVKPQRYIDVRIEGRAYYK